MNAMRDMLALCYWLDNSKKETLEASLADRRKIPPGKANLLRELEEEVRNSKKMIQLPHKA